MSCEKIHLPTNICRGDAFIMEKNGKLLVLTKIKCNKENDIYIMGSGRYSDYDLSGPVYDD